MEWVIENLLRNAVDALPDTGGKVMVRTFYGKQEEVIIEVEDTGKGITRAQASRIFRTGFTTKKRGWGLGLSLSKRIIENFFGGKINLYKSELGKGSVFRIILPENRNFEP
jgi:signal transduction histidine kinase